MKVKDILNHFLLLPYWISSGNTVDKIILGNPDAEIKNILVTWMSDFNAINAAIEGDYQMLMTHEPTFWSHANELDTVNSWSADHPKNGSCTPQEEAY